MRGAIRDDLRLVTGVQGAVAVRPGDTLIVRHSSTRVSQEWADQLKAMVAERCPGVQVLVLGVDEIAVYRP